MGGQPAEQQIIAGVMLTERLAVTMYGAIHRAQWSGQRNLRGLVIDPKMLAEGAFRTALVNEKDIATAIALEHPNIVPTVAVEAGGPDVVVVTRGVGRYVTVQDLITAARSNKSKDGGKLTLPVAAAIGKSVVEALATAHKAKVVHGAVHPRSVLVDEDGGVRLGDFVVGRALTTAVAQGADPALWRGLAGYLSPEVVVGEDPSPASDVFAAGALLFTMLSGEVPPGTLHVTPAVERLVQRALDTDLSRRYKSAIDLLENLLEAFEDDRWDLADRGEVIKAAGLSSTDSNIDDATEDLLASLGSSAASVQVTPMRPSVDLRAEAIAQQQRAQKTPTGALNAITGTPVGGGNRLEALLSDLEDQRELTSVDDLGAFKRDPISELIQMDPRKKEAIVQVKPRVPSLDDPDDETPLPPPTPRDSEPTMPPPVGTKRRSASGDESAALDAIAGLSRAGSRPSARMGSTGNDEIAAMDAIANLDAPVRLSGAADAAEIAAAKLEQAAKRAEAAAARVETNSELERQREPEKPKSKPKPAQPIVDPIIVDDLPAPRIKSRIPGIIGLLVILGLIGGGVYFYLKNKEEAEAEALKKKEDDDRKKREADELTRKLSAAQIDAGAIKVSANTKSSVWLKLGRSPVSSIALPSTQMHELRVEGAPGFQSVDTQVVGAHWSGEGEKRSAKIVVELKPVEKDRKGNPTAKPLPYQPPTPPTATGFVPGRGPVNVEVVCVDGANKKPCDAEVWLFLGTSADLQGVPAGRPYELRILADGYLTKFISIGVDDWRDPKGNPKDPIDVAKKLPAIEKSVTLDPDPNAPKKKGS